MYKVEGIINDTSLVHVNINEGKLIHWIVDTGEHVEVSKIA